MKATAGEALMWWEAALAIDADPMPWSRKGPPSDANNAMPTRKHRILFIKTPFLTSRTYLSVSPILVHEVGAFAIDWALTIMREV
jgi:hypothetical protein